MKKLFSIFLFCLFLIGLFFIASQFYYTGFASYSLPEPSLEEINFLREKYADVLNPTNVKLTLKYLDLEIFDHSGKITSSYPVENVLDKKTNTYWISNRYSYNPRYVDFDLEESQLDSVNLNLGSVPSYFVYNLSVVCLEDNSILNSRLVGSADSYKLINLSLGKVQCSKVQLKFVPISSLRYYQYYFYVYISEISFKGFVEEEISFESSLGEGLLLHYNFNDLNSPAKDLSGNGNDGVVKGTVDFSSGFASFGYSGSGYTNNYIDSGLIANGTNMQSISFWVNYADLSKSNYGVSGYRFGPYVGYWHYPLDGINFRWGYGSSTYGDTLKVLNSNPIAPINSNEWHLLTTTIEDIGNGKYRINGYIDGKKINSEFSTYSGNSAVLRNNSPYTFFIGATNYYGRAYLPVYGSIDDFRIYTRILSDTEVEELFDLGR